MPQIRHLTRPGADTKNKVGRVLNSLWCIKDSSAYADLFFRQYSNARFEQVFSRPFEERTRLKQALDGLLQDNLDLTRQLLVNHERSLWRGKGENQEQWSLLQTALNLVFACEDEERQLPDNSRSQQSLINFYVGSGLSD